MKTARNEQIISTVTTAERNTIDAYADHHGLSRAEVIRRGTLMLASGNYAGVPEEAEAVSTSAVDLEQRRIRELSEELRRLKRDRP